MTTEASFPNRKVELEILQKLFSQYPAQTNVQQWKNDFPQFDKEIHYLHEHELIECMFSKELGAKYPPPLFAKINKNGIDFLADDGGLSAILGAVTIKLHDSTIKSLIEAKIVASSELSQPEKQKYLAQLRSLPADATKHVVLKLAEKGLENFPTVLTWISSLANQA